MANNNEFRIIVDAILDSKSSANIKAQLKQIESEISKNPVKLKVDTGSSNNIKNIKKNVDEIGKSADKTGQSFVDAGRKMMQWTVIGGAIFGTLRQIKQGFQFVYDMDNAMNEIRIVTGQTSEEVQRLAKSYNQLGKEMSVSTTDIAKTSVELYRQGLNEAQVNERMKSIIKYAKISSISLEESNKIITATANATGESVNKIVDVFSNLGDLSASDASELGEALQRVASAAENSNISLEKTVSWVATISSITRESASTIGRSLSSAIARYEQIRTKGFNEEDATKLNDVTKALTAIGIQAVDSTGQLRPFADVIDELGGKYQSLTKNEQSYITTALFGSFQRNRGITLLRNYNQALKNYEIALDSAGAADKKFAIRQESSAAKMEEFKSKIQGMWLNTINGEDVKSLISFGSAIVTVIDKIGLLNTTLLITIGYFSTFKKLQALTLSTLSFSNILGAFTPLAIVGGIMAIASAIDYVSKANERYIESQKKIVTTSNENIQKYQDEENKLISLQKSLQDAQGSKEKLLAISNDLNSTIGETKGLLEGESTAYDVANMKIQDRIKYLNNQIEAEKNAKIAANKEIFEQGKKSYKAGSDTWIDYLSGGVSLQDVDKRLKETQTMRDKNIEMGSSEDSIGIKDLDAKIANYKDFLLQKSQQAKNIFEETINNTFKDETNRGVVNSFIQGLIFGGETDLNSIDTKIQDFSSKLKGIDDLKEKFYNTKAKGENTDSIIGDIVSEMDKLKDTYKDFPEITKLINGLSNSISDLGKSNSTDSIDNLNKQLKNGQITLEDYVNTLSKIKLSEIIDDITSKYKNGEITLSEYIDKVNEIKSATKEYETEVYNLGVAKEFLDGITKKVTDSQSLSKDEVQQLTTLYPQLKSSIIQTADGWTVEKTALDLVTTGVGNLQTAYQTAQNAMTIVLSTQVQGRILYTLSELEAIQTVADAYNSLQSKIKGADNTGFTKRELETRGFSSENQSIINGVVNFAKAKEKINSLLANMGKPNYSALAPKAEKEKQDAGTRPSQPDLLKLDIDRYTELNAAVNNVKNSIEELQLAEEDLYGQDKIKNLDEQIQKTKELADAQNNVWWEQKKERNDLRYVMEQNGFEFSGDFNSTNLATNYNEQLQAMYDKYNAMPYANDADNDARTNYKNNISDIESAYKRIISLNDEVGSSEKDYLTTLQNVSKIKKDQQAIYKEISANIISDLDHEIFLTEQLANKSVDDINKVYNLRLAKMEEYHRRNEELKAQGLEDSDEFRSNSEAWWNTYKENQSQIQSYADAYKKNFELTINVLQEQADKLEYKINKAQALVNATQKKYDTQNSLSDAQAELDKQLASYKSQLPYLTDKEKEGVFNEEDYTELTGLISDLSEETNSITEKYVSDISKLTDKTWYKESAITAQYERRLAMKEKELDIAKQEIELDNKQQALDNALAEKSVRMLVAGQYVQVANMDNVKQASEDLADAQAQLKKLQTEQTQQSIVNTQQAQVDMLNQEKSAKENEIKMINEAADKMQKAFENYFNPVQSIGDLTKSLANVGITQLNKAVNDMLTTFSKVTGNDYDSVDTSTSDTTSSNLSKITVKTRESNGKTIKTYYDANGKLVNAKSYAVGTTNADGGLANVDENGNELLIRPSQGRYTVMEDGAGVLTADITKNLMSIGQYNVEGLANKIANNLPTVKSGSQSFGDHNYNFEKLSIEHVNDYNDFISQLTTKTGQIHKVSNR